MKFLARSTFPTYRFCAAVAKDPCERKLISIIIRKHVSARGAAMEYNRKNTMERKLKQKKEKRNKKDNPNAALRLEKVVVNAGIGRLCTQQQFKEKTLPAIKEELGLITGQAPAPRQAKQSIASFKIRSGDIVGLQITLRGKRMEDFFTKVVRIVLPRVKDFRGLPMSVVDGRGNLNLGFKEQYVFPEVNTDKSKIPFGLQVTAVPTLKNREQAIDFYRNLGVPLRTETKE